MGLLCAAIVVCMLVLVAATVLSWVPVPSGSLLAEVSGALGRLTDVMLLPLRRVVPPVRLGRATIDPSPLVALLVLLVLQWVVC